MTFLKTIISIHLFGLILFNTIGVLGNYYWEAGYFTWDKTVGAGFLIWLMLYWSVPRNQKWVVKPVLLLGICRFFWQVIAYAKGWNFNSQWWLALFFILLALAAGYLTLKENSLPNV